VVGYTGYVGYEGSRQLVDSSDTGRDCRTPDVLYGWSYEAINYDIADDSVLRERNPDQTDCGYEGTEAGDQVVAADGVRIAGWYVPAANGVGPKGPTIILVHGFKATKTGILKYGLGLHDRFNLVAFDLRGSGRSTDRPITAGVLEQLDLRAVIDWLARAKGPDHIGVLGNSLGAATALAEAGGDPRIKALVLDSMHTRIRYQIEARVVHAGYPSFFGTTWAIVLGSWFRTGVDIQSVDAVDQIPRIGDRPVLLTHGTADNEDLPARTLEFHQSLLGNGVPATIEWCPDSGHNADAGMPAEVCQSEFAQWTNAFFTSALVSR
jgi:pimeloyl-ACP methyl ester carboxylesterase